MKSVRLPWRTPGLIKIYEIELEEFMGSASPTGFDLHVNTGFKEAANEMTSITMSIFFKLYADEDYFTLIDRAELDIEKGSE